MPLLPRDWLLPLGGAGVAELDVELAVTEVIFGVDATRAADHFHIAVLHLPFRRLALDRAPRRQTGPVKKHDRIGGRFARLVLGAACARSDDRRPRPRVVVNPPLAARNGWSIGVSSGLVLILRAERGSHKESDDHSLAFIGSSRQAAV